MASATGVRLVLKFNFPQLLRTAGWSESYDLGHTDIPNAQANINKITAFMVDRCYCLGIGAVLVQAVLIAYAQPLTPGAANFRRNSVAIQVPVIPLAGQAYNKDFYSSNPLPADFAPTVYYISLQTDPSSSPTYRRNLWIAGLPDAADETGSVQILEPRTLTAMNKFIGDLNNTNSTLGGQNNVSIRSIDRSGANPIKVCTAWNALANTYTVPAHGFVQNQPIIAEGMRTSPGGIAPRGRYLVSAVVDANTISLQGAVAPTVPQKTGGFRAAIVTFNIVKSAVGNGFTKRDKGRPFGQSVGRRRKSSIVGA